MKKKKTRRFFLFTLLNKIFSSKDDVKINELRLLKEFAFLKNLSKRELSLFRNLLMRRDFKKGEVIFKEGYPHAVLYLLTKGEVEIFLEKENENQVLASVTPYSEFGEIGLFIDSKRTASARCLANTSMFAISKSDFQVFVKNYPSVGIKILYNLGINLSKTIVNTNKLLKSKNETE